MMQIDQSNRNGKIAMAALAGAIGIHHLLIFTTLYFS